MKASKRIIVGISSTALMIGAGSGIAAAAKTNAPPQGGPGGPPGAAAIATYLGLTGDQVRTQLQAGQTLAQIAVAQGKTAAGLEAAIVADAKSHLDADVTAGKLTSAQETTMLADLQSHIDQMVNSSGPPQGGQGGPGGRHGGPGGGPGGAAIATYLGLTGDQVRTQLQGGKTLAQIAVAQGKTAAGLEAAMLADAKSHLDADVTAGKLTSAQETTMLADLQSHIDQMVNASGPPNGGQGGPGGPPNGGQGGPGGPPQGGQGGFGGQMNGVRR